MIKNLSKSNFDDEILKFDLSLVYFWAPWCAPCKNFSEIFNQISERNDDILFGKVNLDEEIDLKKDFNIQSIPHLIIFKSNIAIFSDSGVYSYQELENLIEKSKEIDVTEIKKGIES